ncbi:MAG: MBL fold metallo-hydrolase [Thermoleophilia bacterium]
MTTKSTHEIAPGVHWLHLRGVNVFFVRSGADWTLIDTGFPGAAATIADAAEELVGGEGRAAAILLTHGHPDHAGSAAALATAWDVPIVAPAAELPYMDGGDLYPEPLVHWLKRRLPGGAIAELARRSALQAPLTALDPGQDVPTLPDWIAVPTPGHTPGHTAYFRPSDRTLIAGDALLTLAWPSRLSGGGWLLDLVRRAPRITGPPSGFTCNWGDAATSVAALAELDPWLLASGHGTPLAGPRLAPALRAFAAHARHAGERA